jgi:hypothetical protein
MTQAEEDRAARLNQPHQTPDEALRQLREVSSAPDDGEFKKSDSWLKIAWDSFVYFLKSLKPKFQSPHRSDFQVLKKSGEYLLMLLVLLGVSEGMRYYETWHRFPPIFGTWGASRPQPDAGDIPQAGRFFFHVENPSDQTVIYRMNTITGKIDLVVISGNQTATVKIMDSADETTYTSKLNSVPPIYVKNPDGTFVQK